MYSSVVESLPQHTASSSVLFSQIGKAGGKWIDEELGVGNDPGNEAEWRKTNLEGPPAVWWEGDGDGGRVGKARNG